MGWAWLPLFVLRLVGDCFVSSVVSEIRVCIASRF